MKSKILIGLFLIGCAVSYGQSDSSIDSVIRSNFKSVPASYFVFLINPGIPANTNANVIYLTYKDIQTYSPCKDIYYVMAGIGVTASTLPRYFTEVLRLPFDSINGTIRLDTELNKQLDSLAGGTMISRLLYVYQNQLLLSHPFKFTGKVHLNLPYDLSAIRYEGKVKVNTDKHLHTASNKFYPLPNGHLLQLSDINGRVGILNTQTGELDHILDRSGLKAVDLYERYVTGSKKKIQYARKRENMLAEMNRQDMPVYSAYAEGEHIYIYFAIQVMEKLTKDWHFPDGAGGIATAEKGTTLANLYGFLLQCDTALQIKNLYYVKGPKGIKSNLLALGLGNGFIVDNNHILSFAKPNELYLDKLKKSNYYNKGISRYMVKESLIQFDRLMQAPMVENFEKKMFYYIKGSIFKWNKRIQTVYSSSYLYDVEQDNPISQLTGTGEKDLIERYAQHINDTTEARFAWLYSASGPVFNGQYYAFLYKHNYNPLLEIKNQQWQTVQIIDIKDQLPENYRNVVFSGNRLIFFVQEEGGFYLYQYRLISNCKVD